MAALSLSARTTNWAVLAGLVAIGLVAMVALQMRRAGPGVDMVELLNREPAELSPVLDEAGKAVPLDVVPRQDRDPQPLGAVVRALPEGDAVARPARRAPAGEGLRRRRGDQGSGRPLAVEGAPSTGWG